ncbi:hypothetical protein JCM11491_005992 [Sporobolomyces phaffii]
MDDSRIVTPPWHQSKPPSHASHVSLQGYCTALGLPFDLQDTKAVLRDKLDGWKAQQRSLKKQLADASRPPPRSLSNKRPAPPPDASPETRAPAPRSDLSEWERHLAAMSDPAARDALAYLGRQFDQMRLEWSTVVTEYKAQIARLASLEPSSKPPFYPSVLLPAPSEPVFPSPSPEPEPAAADHPQPEPNLLVAPDPSSSPALILPHDLAAFSTALSDPPRFPSCPSPVTFPAIFDVVKQPQFLWTTYGPKNASEYLNVFEMLQHWEEGIVEPTKAGPGLLAPISLLEQRFGSKVKGTGMRPWTFGICDKDRTRLSFYRTLIQAVESRAEQTPSTTRRTALESLVTESGIPINHTSKFILYLRQQKKLAVAVAPVPTDSGIPS